MVKLEKCKSEQQCHVFYFRNKKLINLQQFQFKNTKYNIIFN